MPSLATRRLIDASATLDPAARALLNLWVNRGFDDDRLARLSGMSTEALHARRDRIVERLGEQLGLPKAVVAEALAELAQTSREATAAAAANGANGVATGAGADAATAFLGPAAARRRAPSAAGLLLGPAGAWRRAPSAAGLLLGPAAAPRAHRVPESATPAPASDPPPSLAAAAPAVLSTLSGHRLLWVSVVGLVVVLGVLVAALASDGGTTPRSAPTNAVARTAAPAVTPTNPNPVPAPPTRTAGGPVTLPLAGLPGGLADAHGAVGLLGPVKHLRLELTFRGLPAVLDGHYEAWLFNSVLDSRPLGRVRLAAHTAIYRLPASGRRFRWIDISFQPAGLANHSGESELRAANPAHTTRARLRKRATRRPRQLSRTASGSSRAKTSK
jgi:hypothetical protein